MVKWKNCKQFSRIIILTFKHIRDSKVILNPLNYTTKIYL